MSNKIPVVLFQSADVWIKNGDHPQDYVGDVEGFEGGELRNFSAEFRKENDWEGGVVRRYRKPDVSGTLVCPHCGFTMQDHGWIESENQVVCPGDFIVNFSKDSNEPKYTAISPVVFISLRSAVLLTGVKLAVTYGISKSQFPKGTILTAEELEYD